MATTSAFGWETPDDTDLVKDGAAAIRTLGNSIDTSMAELKGGTTGQILSKASNTDMDFVWTADAGAPTSLGYAAGKNCVLNGDFRIWQRGTSISLTNNTTAYTTDRWYVYTSFSAGSSSLSQQTFTPGTAPVSGYEGSTFARFTAGSTATYFEFGQRIEDVRQFANQTATLSFWAKASANTSVSSTLLQNFGSGGSTQVSVSGASHSVTTSWTRFTATISVPSISGKTIGTSSYLALTFAANSLTGSQTIDFWGVQLEAGSTATAFQTATGNQASELVACQRYYEVLNQDEITTVPLGIAVYNSSTEAFFTVWFKVKKRIAPTLTVTGGVTTYVTGTGRNSTSVVADQISASAASLKATTSAATAGNASIAFLNNSVTSKFEFSAEL